ncbi:MAG: MFS transporter [Pseudomonadota bacterium]
MTTQLLRSNRNYRLLFSASAISNLGDGISALAFPWLATLITRDPFLIALVAFATRLPWMLFAIPAGVVIDRTDRQRIMVRSDLTRLFLSFAVVMLIFAAPSMPLGDENTGATGLILALSVIAFLLGTAEVFRDNAAQTVLPTLVDKRELETANGQMWSMEQIMGSFVGPPLAGVLIALAVPLPFAFDALMFGVAAMCVAMIAFPARTAERLPSGFWQDMKEGVVWLFRHRLILQLAVMLGFLNLFHIMTLTVLVLFSQEVLGLGAFGYGVLLTAGAAGGVVGGIICPYLSTRIGPQKSLLVALVVFPIADLVIWQTTSSILVGVALCFGMLAAVLWNVVTVSYRQRFIPDDLLGRVNAIYRFFGWGMMPIGALIGGAVVSLFDPSLGRIEALRLPFLLAALGNVALLVYALIALRFPAPASD